MGARRLPGRNTNSIDSLQNNQLSCSDAQDDDLERHERNSESDASLALPAKSAKVRPHSHGHVAPLAAPALDGVDLLGCIDGVEEGNGDYGSNKGDDGRHEDEDGIEDSQVIELEVLLANGVLNLGEKSAPV